MPSREIIVIGASAGGVEALRCICARLPADLEAAVLVVQHTSSNSLLPQILTRAGPLPAVHPEDKESIQKGRIYVAPPDFHMIVEAGWIRLFQGARENRHRPAIDPLFRSAANGYGPKTVGVILTGLLDDGTSGLMTVKAQNGAAVVQDPASALFPSMPASALEGVPDAFVAPVTEIPQLLVQLVNEQVQSSSKPDVVAGKEVGFAELNMEEIENEIQFGKASAYSCPECGGVLWEIDQNGLLRFRCRVGHAYTAKNLEAEQHVKIEAAIWAALRALEERASLYRRMAARARGVKHELSMTDFARRESDANEHAKVLRELLRKVNPLPTEQQEQEAA